MSSVESSSSSAALSAPAPLPSPSHADHAFARRFAPIAAPAAFAVSLHHDSICVAGLYLKWDRELSQTPFMVGNVLLTKDSVEDLMARPLCPVFGATGMPLLFVFKFANRILSISCANLNYFHVITFSVPVPGTKFHSSGREDMDVRMLGAHTAQQLRLFDASVLNADSAAFHVIDAPARTATTASSAAASIATASVSVPVSSSLPASSSAPASSTSSSDPAASGATVASSALGWGMVDPRSHAEADGLASGVGRQFVLELVDPHCPYPDVPENDDDAAVSASASSTSPPLSGTNEAAGGSSLALARFCQRTINTSAEAADRLQVHALAMTNKAFFEVLRHGETKKVKEYKCIVWSSMPVTAADLARLTAQCDDLLVVQRTPLRVSHRRSLMDRKRVVHQARAELFACMPATASSSPSSSSSSSSSAHEPRSFFFYLTMSTQAGMYIKEFVHGDKGRTRPSVADLLGGGRTADILQLDVVQLLPKRRLAPELEAQLDDDDDAE